MKFVFLFTFFLLSCFFVNAQKKNYFSLKWNNKEIIKKQTIPTDPVACTIKKSSLLKTNLLTITYMDKDTASNWHKVFIFNDENDLEINRSVQKTISGVFTIQLKLPVDFKLGTIKIQTLNEPNDPNQAALIRLRTYSLANITIK